MKLNKQKFQAWAQTRAVAEVAAVCHAFEMTEDEVADVFDTTVQEVEKHGYYDKVRTHFSPLNPLN